MSDVKRYTFINGLHTVKTLEERALFTGKRELVLAADYDALAAELATACQGAKAAIAAGGKVAAQLAKADARIAQLEGNSTERAYLEKTEIELIKARERIERLEAALRKYGKHDPNRCFVAGDEPEIICHCGLRAALASKPPITVTDNNDISIIAPKEPTDG